MPAAASDPKTIAHEAPKRMTGAKSDTLSNARSLLSVIKASLEAHPDERDDGWEWGCVVMIDSVQDLIAHEEIRPDQSATQDVEPEQHRESSQFEAIKREVILAAEDLMAEEDSRMFTAEAAHSIIEGAIMLGVDAVSGPPANHILRKRLIRA